MIVYGPAENQDGNYFEEGIQEGGTKAGFFEGEGLLEVDLDVGRGRAVFRVVSGGGGESGGVFYLFARVIPVEVFAGCVGSEDTAYTVGNEA